MYCWKCSSPIISNPFLSYALLRSAISSTCTGSGVGLGVGSGGCVDDKNGLLIVGEEHFQQYISFKNIQVYEQCGDTFMDAVAVNEYPDTLVCALNIRFFDEDGTEIASGRVQTRDGQYVLRLENGDNTLFAQIDTDMTLTDKEFRLEYSEDLNVLPE